MKCYVNILSTVLFKPFIYIDPDLNYEFEVSLKSWLFSKCITIYSDVAGQQ